MHDKEALQEMHDKAFIKNTITYDAHDGMLSTIRHEALYAAYILTEQIKYNREKETLHINSLQELPEDVNMYNDDLDRPIRIEGNPLVHSYGMCLFNKWCGFDKVIINKIVDKHSTDWVSRSIYLYNNQDNDLYYKQLTKLSKLLFVFVSVTDYCPSLHVKDMISMVDERTQILFNNLPRKKVELGYLINSGLVERCLEESDQNSQLQKLYKSGSRFSKTQLARSCINIGLNASPLY